MFDIKRYLVQKTNESYLFCGLTPSFHVIKLQAYSFSDCNFAVKNIYQIIFEKCNKN